MTWTWDIDRDTLKSEPALKLSVAEVELLVKILKKPLRDYRKKLEQLQDIHYAGEASTRQENMLLEAEDAVKFIEAIIKNTD